MNAIAAAAFDNGEDGEFEAVAGCVVFVVNSGSSGRSSLGILKDRCGGTAELSVLLGTLKVFLDGVIGAVFDLPSGGLESPLIKSSDKVGLLIDLRARVDVDFVNGDMTSSIKGL